MATPILNDGIVDLFCIILPKNNKIFKGTDAPTLDLTRTTASWFSRDKKECKKYGKQILTFSSRRNLKLINITSHIFRMHFLDQINLAMADDSIAKEDLLVPVGLPNTRVQRAIVDKNVSSHTRPEFCHNKEDDETKQTKYLSEFFGFHRYSGKILDANMVQMMKNIYGKYVDGYIQPMQLPTCWHDTFADEICLFDVSKCNLSPHKNSQGGGKKTKQCGGMPYEFNRECTDEEWQSIQDKLAKVIGNYQVVDSAHWKEFEP
jgi:hypothetical protein